jgi:hypothetical protein
MCYHATLNGPMYRVAKELPTRDHMVLSSCRDAQVIHCYLISHPLSQTRYLAILKLGYSEIIKLDPYSALVTMLVCGKHTARHLQQCLVGLTLVQWSRYIHSDRITQYQPLQNVKPVLLFLTHNNSLGMMIIMT